MANAKAVIDATGRYVKWLGVLEGSATDFNAAQGVIGLLTVNDSKGLFAAVP